MERISRQRRSESAWREIVERQGQSGLTVPEFCEREGIKAASLYGWRSRLREGSQSPPAPPTVPKRSKRSEVPASGFIDLGSLGASGSRFEVRLELGGGVLLHLVQG
jgi:transposase-like protein